MRNLEEDNQSNKHLVVGSIEVLEDISGNGVKTIKQSIEKIDNNLNAAIAIQNNYWSQLSSDRTISPVEKKTIYKEFQNIQNTHLSIMAAAETLGYLSELQIVEYQEKYTALYNYLITTLKLFDNLEEATNISSRTKFDGYFTAYYDKEFRARTLLSKGQGGGYQDYQFAVGDLDDYPTDDSQWHDGPPEVPAGKYLWCRTRWVDAEGYAGQWYTFRIQGTNGSYHEYQFSQGSKEEHTTVESEWYDAPPSIEEGYYLWCRQRYVDTNGDPEEWSYFRIDGSNGGWQDTEFAAGELDSYPTSESAWTDAPPTIPEHKYLWQRTRWIQDDTKSEWTYTRLSGASAGYQDYQFAIGTLSGFIVPIYINNKELYINNSRLVIQDPLLGDWYDAPPAVPEGMYLWCRTRWIDENGVAGEWRYFRMSGQVGGYQDYMFAAGDLDSYPTSEASWHDAPPTIPEGKYLWQRTRWIEDNKPTEEWTYTRLQGENADDVIVMFSVNGSSNWHLNFQDGDFYMKVSTDGGTTYTAPAKIVGENAPEVKTLYSIDGTSNWHETFTEGDFFMKLSTDDGLTWTDPARIVGENAPEMQTKYSIDGTSNWHFPYAEGDYFMITSTDGGETWSDPMRVVGENAPATLALYGQTRDGSFHSTFTEGDYFMKLSIDGGLTYGDPIQIVGEDGASVYAQYSTDGEEWHNPPFVEGDLYMRTSSDGITWSDAARIVAEATEKYIGAKDAYIEPAAGTYFLAIINFVNPLEETVIINESELKINNKTLVIQQQFTAGMIYHSGEDLVWRAVLDRNDWRYLVATCDLKKYNLDLAPAVEEIFSDHLQPIEAQIEEHKGQITVINNQLVVIDENIATKLDKADYHIPINKGSLYADPQDAQEGDFYVYVGPESQTRHKSNVYVFTENEWIEKDPTSNQDGAYYMACLNQILDANVNEEGYFAVVFAASMYANTAWLTQVHSSIIHLSEYGTIETDDYQAGATFTDDGITAAEGGNGFKLQDAVGDIPAYLDMNGYAHFGNDVLIDGNMKATNAEIHGKVEASELTLSQSCTVGDKLTLGQDGKITATGVDITGKITATALVINKSTARDIYELSGLGAIQLYVYSDPTTYKVGIKFTEGIDVTITVPQGTNVTRISKSDYNNVISSKTFITGSTSSTQREEQCNKVIEELNKVTEDDLVIITGCGINTITSEIRNKIKSLGGNTSGTYTCANRNYVVVGQLGLTENAGYEKVEYGTRCDLAVSVYKDVGLEDKPLTEADVKDLVGSDIKDVRKIYKIVNIQIDAQGNRTVPTVTSPEQWNYSYEWSENKYIVQENQILFSCTQYLTFNNVYSCTKAAIDTDTVIDTENGYIRTNLIDVDTLIADEGLFNKIGFRNLRTGNFTIWTDNRNKIATNTSQTEKELKLRISPCLYTSTIKLIIEGTTSAGSDTGASCQVQNDIYVKVNGSVSTSNYDYHDNNSKTESGSGRAGGTITDTLTRDYTLSTPTDYIEVLIKGTTNWFITSIASKITVQTDVNNPLAGRFMIFDEI